jgi:hypothetical protein
MHYITKASAVLKLKLRDLVSNLTWDRYIHFFFP